jgi:hypothetical protein
MPRGTVAKKGRAIAQGYHAADGATAVRAAVTVPRRQAFKAVSRMVDTGIDADRDPEAFVVPPAPHRRSRRRLRSAGRARGDLKRLRRDGDSRPILIPIPLRLAEPVAR